MKQGVTIQNNTHKKIYPDTSCDVYKTMSKRKNTHTALKAVLYKHNRTVTNNCIFHFRAAEDGSWDRRNGNRQWNEGEVAEPGIDN